MRTLYNTKQGSLANGVINALLNTEYNAAKKARYEPLKTLEEQANFYQLSRLATEYAHIFYGEIAIETIRPRFIPYLLPLTFISEDEATIRALAADPNAKTADAGQVASDPFTEGRFMIQIALPNMKRAYLTKAIKTAIRHEIIHYHLILQGLPHEDDSALFWAYCYIYDGHAYTPISEDEDKYLEFVQAAEAEVESVPIYALHYLAEAIILGDDYAKEKYKEAKENPQAFLNKLQRTIDRGKMMK